MEYKTITGTNLKISRIGLGTWSIGGWMWGGSSETDSIATVHKALAEGINFFDTAPVYGFGESELVLGKALKGRRDEVVIATKVGLDFSSGKPTRNSSAASITAELEASLRRLNTDFIDIYQVHWPDQSVPIAEVAQALEKLFAEGKIRAIGVSNFSVAEMEEFSRFAPLHTAQPPYNIFERDIEFDVLPHCIDEEISVFAYGAICRGLLSGSVKMNTKFKDDDIRNLDPKFQPLRRQQYVKAVERLDAFAQAAYGKNVLELALRWLLDHPGVTAALWGARRPEQLEALSGVMGWTLDAGGFAVVDEIVFESVADPIGPQFMAPPANAQVNFQTA